MSAAALSAMTRASPSDVHEGLSRPPPERSVRGNDDERLARAAAWTWSVRQPSVTAGVATAVAFDPSGEGLVACGSGGLMRWQGQGWRPVVSGPRDPSAVRGLVRLPGSEVLAFGARGYVARVRTDGEVEPWSFPEREATFHAAHVDDAGTVILVGDRTPRPAERAAGQEAGVAFVAQSVGAICAGHLLAIAALPSGGAVTVGAGGHALSLSPALAPQLEAVQTTRHLLSLAVDPDGVAWAGSAQARILRRHRGGWLRMSGELGLTSAVVAIWAGPQSVRAVCDDGAIVQGSVVPG